MAEARWYPGRSCCFWYEEGAFTSQQGHVRSHENEAGAGKQRKGKSMSKLDLEYDQDVSRSRTEQKQLFKRVIGIIGVSTYSHSHSRFSQVAVDQSSSARSIMHLLLTPIPPII
jgi:hypothetical protein